MSKRFGLVSALVLALAFPAVAPAVAGAASTSRTSAVAPLQTQQARFGGFRARPSYGSRYRSPRYGTRYGRPHPFRGLGGSILRALGIAYLFHMLFGWGGGGSPFGLLLLAGLILWLVTRTRRRRRPYAY
jgi:predicted lipid-binding transport protein (Tim44 family)